MMLLSPLCLRLRTRWWRREMMMMIYIFLAMEISHCAAFMVHPSSPSPIVVLSARFRHGFGNGATVGARARSILDKATSLERQPSTCRLYSSWPPQREVAISVAAATAKAATMQAAVVTRQRPSVSTVIAWILALILLRTKWNTLPNWLQYLALMPYRKLIRNPFLMLRRKLLQRIKKYNPTAVSLVTTTNGQSGAQKQDDVKEQSRLEMGVSKIFGDSGSSSSNDMEDANVDNDDDDGGKVWRKLQNAMSLAQAATDSVAFEGFQMQVALLVMLQMVEESKKTTAELWDKFYESSGQPLLAAATVDTNSNNATVVGEGGVVVDGASNAANVDAVKDTVAAAEQMDALITTWIDRLRLADWAYLDETIDIQRKLKEQENSTSYQWHLVRHVKTNEPGRVGHYIALDTQAKVALISVKGTSDVADMITDACGLPVRYNMTTCVSDDKYRDETTISGDQESTTTTVMLSCHEGILDASLALAQDIQPLVEELFLPAGYKILLVGHSLGAGVACMVGNLLRSRIPALCKPQPQPCLLNDSHSVLTDGDDVKSPITMALPLEVVAFAPPPMLNFEAAIATTEFTTSIVNNDDMIPRTSITNLVSLIRFLAIVDKRLGEKGLRPTGPVGAVQLLTKALVGSLKGSSKKENDEQDEAPTGEESSDYDGENDAIMTGQEIFDGLNEARQGQGKRTTVNYRQQVMDDLDHLFVPGKVVVLYEKHAVADEDSTPTANPTGKTSATGKQMTKGLAKDLTTMISEMLYKKKEDDGKDKEKDEPDVIIADAIVADGAAPVLRHINLNRRMISDHMPDAYEKTLQALLQRKD